MDPKGCANAVVDAQRCIRYDIEIARTVPGSGNLTACGLQFWFGPDRARQSITLWVDTTVVHLLVNGMGLKTVPSRFTTAQLRQLLADGGRLAGPPPIPIPTAMRSREP
ncbi:MAG TPA: hypothetical protein VEX40_11205 [Mycobacterium sp.]|nr:hypothetical protein [Mycobacterium sp.]